tara:strand:+ start:400 stop:639 length:240 start_codon:yes stop_codon:yes gene_type:complete
MVKNRRKIYTELGVRGGRRFSSESLHRVVGLKVVRNPLKIADLANDYIQMEITINGEDGLYVKEITLFADSDVEDDVFK